MGVHRHASGRYTQPYSAGVGRQSTSRQQVAAAFDEFRRTRDTDVIDVAQVTAAIKHTAVRVTVCVLRVNA